jgi:hypothetical protein
VISFDHRVNNKHNLWTEDRMTVNIRGL